MAKGRAEPRLLQKAAHQAAVLRQLGLDDLDRDRDFQPPMVAEVDVPHPTAANAALDIYGTNGLVFES
jgi:hypothetical protein